MSSDRRPLSSVGAYRQAGISPRNTGLLPSTMAQIDQWRACPKFEEAMLLGHLRSQKHNLPKPELWKLKRFQYIPGHGVN